LLVPFWLTATPPLPATQAKGRERYEAYMLAWTTTVQKIGNREGH